MVALDEKFPLALPLGTVLAGQYIIQRVLGQGGFGITYEVMDHKTGARYALKEYFPDSLATRVDRTMVSPFSGERGESYEYGKACFLQEAETLSLFIGNENIVRIYSYFEEYGTAYFVMDYIEGTSFDSYIKQQGGRVSYYDAFRILLPIMEALDAVHTKGIIHRDVTPDNVYLTKEGIVKLLDFGAARYSLGDKSRSLDIVLKHGFAPKEQYTRRGKQGPFTDVYALGATFYFALTGRRPPDSVDRLEEDDLIPPSSLGVQISEKAENAILKALEVRAQDRYQSMGEFRKDIIAAGIPAAPVVQQPEQPVETQPQMIPQPQVQASQAQPVQTQATVAQPQPTVQQLVQTQATIAQPQTAAQQPAQPQTAAPQPEPQTMTQQPEQTQAAPAQEEKPKKKKTGLIIGIAAAASVLVIGGVGAAIALSGLGGGEQIVINEKNDDEVKVGESVTNPEKPSEPENPVEADPPVISEPEATVPYIIITDSNGEPIDLGGIEIVLRDWMTDPNLNSMTDPQNDYEEAVKEYREWAMDTYNFTFKQEAMSDWGSSPDDYMDYVITGGDSNNYLFALPDGGFARIINSAPELFYDLSTIDGFDLTNEKYRRNKRSENYTFNGRVLAMSGEIIQPVYGLFINEDILAENGIDVNDIYDAQKNGTWDWDMFIDMMETVRLGAEGGVYALAAGDSYLTQSFIYSSGATFIDKDGDEFVNGLHNSWALTAAYVSTNMISLYCAPKQVDTTWDAYRETFVSGHAAFCLEGEYMIEQSMFSDVPFNLGFVMFPAGPEGKMQNISGSTPAIAIPGCYGSDTAWRLAMAYDIWTEVPPGYEDYNQYAENAKNTPLDERAINETIPMMCDPEYVVPYYQWEVSEINVNDLLWRIAPGEDLDSIFESMTDVWDIYLAEINASY